MCSTVLAWGYSSGLLALRFVKSSFCVLKDYWSSKILPSQALAFCYFSSPIRTSLSSSKLSCFLWFEYISPSRITWNSCFLLLLFLQNRHSGLQKKTSVTSQTYTCPLLLSVHLIVVSGQLTFVYFFFHICIFVLCQPQRRWAPWLFSPSGCSPLLSPQGLVPSRYHQRSLDRSNESIGDQPEKYWLIEWMISFAS